MNKLCTAQKEYDLIIAHLGRARQGETSRGSEQVNGKGKAGVFPQNQEPCPLLLAHCLATLTRKGWQEMAF